MPTVSIPPAARALLDSPTLPRHLRALQETMAQEAARREHFLEALSPDEKSEFINGEVIVHSPARHRHNDVTARLVALLKPYVTLHDLGTVVAEKALISLTRNDYEPDVCFFGREKTSEITPDTLRYPAPDLVIEVLSPSTEVRDRGVKLEDYAAHGVAEYWLLDPDAETAEVYVLDEESETYALRLKSDHGTLASVAVEGFAVPLRAAFDDAENLAALRSLLAA
ncbi:MAG: Uma2 family endonuclease [Bacteroidota bacterium]